MTDGSSEKQTARELVASASRIVGFTGAGISTESRVPDFRSPEGVWAHNRTVYFQEFLSSEADRIEYWRQKMEGWPAMRDARPNAGHHAFVALHAQGKLQAMPATWMSVQSTWNRVALTVTRSSRHERRSPTS